MREYQWEGPSGKFVMPYITVRTGVNENFGGFMQGLVWNCLKEKKMRSGDPVGFF
jgi:hypothetical protein